MRSHGEIVYWYIKVHPLLYVNQVQVRINDESQVLTCRPWDDFFCLKQTVPNDFERGEQVASVREDFDAT